MPWNKDNPRDDLARSGDIENLLNEISAGNSHIVEGLGRLFHEVRALRLAVESLNPISRAAGAESGREMIDHQPAATREKSSPSPPTQTSLAAAPVDPFTKDQLRAPTTLSDEVTEEDRELLDKCIEIIGQEKWCSTATLSRRLRIGYTRAARMVDILRMLGSVGPEHGVLGFEILWIPRITDNTTPPTAAAPASTAKRQSLAEMMAERRLISLATSGGLGT